MKEFHCGSLVPGCEWHTRHEEEAEVIRRAAEHMRERPTLGSTGRRCATYAHGGGAGWRRGCAC